MAFHTLFWKKTLEMTRASQYLNILIWWKTVPGPVPVEIKTVSILEPRAGTSLRSSCDCISMAKKLAMCSTGLSCHLRIHSIENDKYSICFCYWSQVTLGIFWSKTISLIFYFINIIEYDLIYFRLDSQG